MSSTAVRKDLNDAGVSVSPKTIRSRLADWVFSGTGLELVTSQPRSETLTTGLPWPKTYGSSCPKVGLEMLGVTEDVYKHDVDRLKIKEKSLSVIEFSKLRIFLQPEHYFEQY
ncbi:hypothetical protein TNCV_3499621 [Trichonephila clavipes]|nr:hypothetical protein TNCV_3499621 [Trichonephila clavipes]